MRGDLLTDETIEAFFAGSSDPAWEHNESLATLANDMAMVVDAPAPVANHALRQLFWETAAAAETATVVATPSRAVARTGDGGLSAFRGRLRLIAGAALGGAVALSGVGVAGAAGVLPAPAQRAVARVVEVVSPFEFPQPGGHLPGPSGGGAVTTGDDPGRQAPTAGQPPTDSPSAASSDLPQGTAPSSEPPSAPPTSPGSNGLDTARQTPAGHSIPPFVPGPGAPSSPSPGGSSNTPASGLDTARQTPAAAAVPTSVPGPPTAVPAPTHGP